jgi:hypothetical protein
VLLLRQLLSKVDTLTSFHEDLWMFVAPRQYQAVLTKMVLEEKKLDVAVAFWGEGAELRVHPDSSKPIRIVCNLRSGGTNPAVVQLFMERANQHSHVEVRQCDRLHAKVLLGQEQALLGSANLSANGLGFEAMETAHWLEAGLHTRDLSEVQSAQAWFEQLWNSSQVRRITNEDLKHAAEAYNRNRNGRPDYSEPGPFSFGLYDPSGLAARHAYALIYVDRPSEEAEAATAQHLKEEASKYGATEIKSRGADRWTFENWPDSLDTTEQNEYLCLLWKEATGAVAVDGTCRMTGTRLHFYYEEGGVEGRVDLAKPAKSLLGHRLNRTDCKALAKELKPVMGAIWEQAEPLDEGSRRIHLSQIARILES